MKPEIREKQVVVRPEFYETSLVYKFTDIIKGVYVLPITAFFSCILLSLYFNFEATTNTHCNVENYLPSVSAAIGTFPLQKFLWQYLIALHTPPRLFVAFLYRSYFKTFNSLSSGSVFLNLAVDVITVTDLIENLSLLLLTIVSSRENYYYHEKAFLTFLFTSQVHMLLKIFLIRKLKNDPQYSDTKSLRIKTMLWLINITAVILSAYFFVRHNNHCETGVYTLFALCEYTIVLTNIAYHGTGFLEFSNTAMTLEIGALSKAKSKPS
ncbi:hypothetical protein HELRODRAFT_92277 [Helobdella robusta]|uniref:CWH43-like N-terminal domain-containing protein n=1 Tax=Helobdella robusta TaxID=6412 RepID=T1G8D8_HELRO|nr:hypothetical protein HELRODRAFT_92277 [Helobdella robusta]ESO09633.1 hypothetical protein HELRODRAFT_92277 [Helobdella robusta]